jgi:DNA-binding response OmpR family regulator
VAYHGAVADGTVLVVDDDTVILKLLQVNFELEGYDVITAPGGAEALRQARDRSLDVVVLDVMMPGIDGLEVARRLHDDPATASLPILLLSAKAQVADIDAGRELADDYMTKPFDAIDLLERVGALLARDGAKRARPDQRSSEA